jgi:hypothetical protein
MVKLDYAALAAISVSHLYNPRKLTAYARQWRYFLTRMDASVGSQWKVYGVSLVG